MSDKRIGRHVGTGKPVFQCAKTRLLYFFGDPPKRYCSSRDVAIGDDPPPSPPCRPKDKKKK
jgi:hypothetical protein